MLGLCVIVGCRPGVTAAGDANADAGADARPNAVERDASAYADADANADADAGSRPPPVAPRRADAGPRSEWCIEGLGSIDDDACYVLPALAPGKPARLLVYLHGIVPPVATSVQKQTVEGAVLAAATRAGAAALVPRGRRGIGPEGARDWWAWPTSPATHAQLVKELVARWGVLKKKLEAIAGVSFERTYLAGSSNGAYFVSALALRGDCDELGLPIDGYGAMSGGSPGGRGADTLKARAPRPVYVGFGTHDAETRKGAQALAAVFEAARWPLRLAEHPFGHGAREIYLDEALSFWDAAVIRDGGEAR